MPVLLLKEGEKRRETGGGKDGWSMSESNEDGRVLGIAVLGRKTVGEERNILAKQVCWQIIERALKKKILRYTVSYAQNV